uniref:Uncharacterized protein n=1 Tax=Otus sunia TaxID=257818 RepID=A0A8C8B8E6_9STRI
GVAAAVAGCGGPVAGGRVAGRRLGTIEDCLPPLEDSPSKRFSPSKRKQYYINKAIRNSDLIPRAKGRKSLQRLENSKGPGRAASAGSPRAVSSPAQAAAAPKPCAAGGAGGAGPLRGLCLPSQGLCSSPQLAT